MQYNLQTCPRVHKGLLKENWSRGRNPGNFEVLCLCNKERKKHFKIIKNEFLDYLLVLSFVYVRDTKRYPLSNKTNSVVFNVTPIKYYITKRFCITYIRIENNMQKLIYRHVHGIIYQSTLKRNLFDITYELKQNYIFV